jgi:hypothetical protein
MEGSGSSGQDSARTTTTKFSPLHDMHKAAVSGEECVLSIHAYQQILNKYQDMLLLSVSFSRDWPCRVAGVLADSELS